MERAGCKLVSGEIMTVEAAEPHLGTHAFVHTGKLTNTLGLALKNAALSILTLTLYRFWARTSMRKRVWSRVWIMGDPLEYTGTASELFRGFLISLPCFFLPAIFVLYVAPFVVDRTSAGLLSFAFYTLAVPLIAAARYWMRRYQLTRTRWRGIRLGLAGSAWSFAMASWGWTMLQSLTLGWYTPTARINRARLLWENARFGDQPFQFAENDSNTTKGMWWPFAMGWFGMWGALFIASMAMGIGAVAIAAGGGMDPENPQMSPIYFAVVAGAVVLGLLVSVLMWTPYNAAAMNRIASLITLDGARFRLKVKTFGLFGVTLASWLIIIFSIGLLAPLAGLLQVRYALNRLELVGTPRFADINQSTIVAPGAGESFADAFDLDLGVGMI